MKYTLLELTQKILSSLDGDSVTSINDTAEARQIAELIQTVYFDIIGRSNLPEHNSFIQCTDSGDDTKPTLMYIPDSVNKIYWLKYDCRESGDTDPQMQNMTYVDLRTFMDRQLTLQPSDSTVGSMNIESNSLSFSVPYTNNMAPKYYTTLDDYTLLFDSYDSAVDTRLLGSKTFAAIQTVIPFTMTDDFTPSLDDAQFPLLLNEAKSLSWAELRQTSHAKAEQLSKRAWSALQKTKQRSEDLTDFDKLPNFGRK